MNALDHERRRRILAKIHILAAERLTSPGDPDGRSALHDLVRHVTEGEHESCAECTLRELGWVIDQLTGEQRPIPSPRNPHPRPLPGGREGGGPHPRPLPKLGQGKTGVGRGWGGQRFADQAAFVRALACRVSARFPQRGGGAFGDTLLLAKFQTADPATMTPTERRQAIAILKSYLGG